MAGGSIARRLVAGLVLQMVILACCANAEGPDPILELFAESWSLHCDVNVHHALERPFRSSWQLRATR